MNSNVKCYNGKGANRLAQKKKQWRASKKQHTIKSKQHPRYFEEAFEKRIGRKPSEYILSKLESSKVEDIRYLFDIVSAEIARANNCICLGFDYYYAKTMEAQQMNQKKVIKYNKLVRDKVPTIIEISGKKCKTRVLSDAEYIQMLDTKLSEELTEYQKSNSIEELADLLEVMGAVVKARGWTWEQLTQVRKDKCAERGAFNQRILLEEIIDK